MVIKVTDQNEQPPIFHDTPYEATVVENKVYSDSVVLKVYIYFNIFLYILVFACFVIQPKAFFVNHASWRRNERLSRNSGFLL